MAVTTLTDPNEPGEIVLLEWPSARETRRWSNWVDQSVTVSDDGRVYWPAWVLGFAAGDAGGDGIYTVRGSEKPHLIASGAEPVLNDLAWTVDGLRGTTSNSHQLAALPFGSDTIEVLADQPAQEVGAFWASPDGRTSAWSEGWFGTSVTVDTPLRRRVVQVGGSDQRSLAMTPDNKNVVVASWDGGTRMVDVETGRSELILRGQQQFIAVSSSGDLAWAADDQIGHGRLCTASLASLAD
jgi:DNA-binding beta-propeller fold protein YncE